MTTKLVGEEFLNAEAIGAGRVVEGYELERCTFVGSALVQWDDPEPSLVVRDITATRCTLDNCSVVGARFEDVTINHLTVRGGTLYLNGCVFSRVKLSGRIGPLTAVGPMAGLDRELSPHADQAMVDAYASVDWALDVSEAECAGVELPYVPGDLVRRDPETQFLLRRESVEALDPRALPKNADQFLDRLASSPFDTMVAIAPKRSRYFRSFLETLQAMRELGLAE
ncbi:hypothetical protein ACFYT4_09610 [Streptomyces sp. NPDC004609]|uniref:hypothetical protein n=1 Tax=Streptomyces sp. NPDC004609 TaxID=3364704 RepID=UPI003695FA6C